MQRGFSHIDKNEAVKTCIGVSSLPHFLYLQVHAPEMFIDPAYYFLITLLWPLPEIDGFVITKRREKTVSGKLFLDEIQCLLRISADCVVMVA